MSAQSPLILLPAGDVAEPEQRTAEAVVGLRDLRVRITEHPRA